jgi:anti-anti-sigma regulatory factor
MVAPLNAVESRQALAVNLQFTRGRHGAAARIELADSPSGRLATLLLLGWVDLAAGRRIEQTLEDLAARGASGLVIDCSQLRHIDYRMVPRLVAAIGRFEQRAGSVAVCGLSRYLQDLFRLAGCDVQLQRWPSAAHLLASAHGHPGETAS